MVTSERSIKSVFRLIRWPNLLIVAVSQILMRQCILIPILRTANMEPQMSFSLFLLLVLSTVLITAGGYAINDYFDRKIDIINKPGDLVVGVSVFPRHAMAWHLFLTVSGVLLGSFVAIHTGQAFLSLIFFMVSGLLWFYSTTYKRELLLGNLMIALLTALVPFMVLIFELPLLAKAYGTPFHEISRYIGIWFTGFTVFAFLLNLAREIVKDAQDFEGDILYGKKTIPVAWGVNAARIISTGLLILTIVLLLFSWYSFIGDNLTLIYFAVTIVIPLIFIIYKLIAAEGKTSYRIVNIWLKVVMISGLGYAVVANLIVNGYSK